MIESTTDIPSLEGPHHERQPAHQLIEYLILWLLITGEREKNLDRIKEIMGKDT